MARHGDDDIADKRVFAGRGRDVDLLVGGADGLLRVSVSGALVGSFGLVHRGAIRDVAADDERVVIATATDVFVADRAPSTELEFEPTGLGPARAVSIRAGLRATDGSEVLHYDGGWERTTTLAGVSAIDGALVATSAGVFRADGSPLGLEECEDVDSSAAPLAATAAGLYRLGNGWMAIPETADERIRVVTSASEDGRALAAGERLYERAADGAADGWRAVELPARLVGLALADTGYGVTEAGSLWAYDPAEDAWRSQPLGVDGVRAMALLPGR